MSVLTLILAGGQGSRLSILGERRAKPAVAFAGKYRIIDFALSNVVNSELYQVAVLTQYRPHSLMEHIGIGEPWDLNRTAPKGVRIWQPYRGRKDQDWYRGTADALYQNRSFIAEAGCDRLLILGGDHIYKMDYRELLNFHNDKGADLTVAVMNVAPEETHRFGIMDVDSNDRIVKFTEKPKHATSTLASMGIYVFNTDFLLNYLEADGQDPNSAHDFGKNLIPKMSPTTRCTPIRSAATGWTSHHPILLGNQPVPAGRPVAAGPGRPELGDPHPLKGASSGPDRRAGRYPR